MKVIASTTVEERKNDCYSEKSISLVEVLEMYMILIEEKIDGQNNVNFQFYPNATYNLMEALTMYKQAGGYLEMPK